LAFLLLGFVGILNHEIWRDEAQAWLIAIHSPSLPALFDVLHYEGHPALWYLCLRLIGAFTHHPVAMQLFHLTIAAAVVYVFVQFSPFTRLQKLLFTFGYYPLFEYGLVSRSYSLGILMLFLFCSCFRNRTRGYILMSVLLALLANTSAYGSILAICLAAALCFEPLMERWLARSDQPSVRAISVPKWNLAVSAVIFSIGIIIAIGQILPPLDYLTSYFHDRSFQGSETSINNTQVHSLFNAAELIDTLKNEVFEITRTIVTIWKSYVPISELSIDNYDFWNENFLMGDNVGLKMLAVVLSLLLLGFCSLLFIEKPVVLFIYLSGTLGILLFIHKVFYGALRHHGHLFLLLLVCLWLSQYYPKQFKKLKLIQLTHGLRKQEHTFLVAILSIHVIAGLFSWGMDVIHPFSASKEVAAYIQSQPLQPSLIIGSEDKKMTPIAAWLNRDIYYLESDRLGNYIHLEQRSPINPEDILSAAYQVVDANQTDALLILSRQLPTAQPSDNRLTFLSSFDRSLVSLETYFLYWMRAKNSENAENSPSTS
jgi:hypothetical protein